MQKVNLNLTAKEYEALKRESAETGLSLSEIVRRAVDAWQAMRQARILKGKA